MDLYALPPEEFTAARDAAAKTDKTLRQLRRPTVSAWVVNTLVRQDGSLFEHLLDVGHDLRQAQSSRDGAALRSLTEQRHQVVEAAADRAVALTGRVVSPAVRAEVTATLEAALLDPASGAAARSGRLVRPLSYAGLGDVDLQDAVADAPGALPERQPDAVRGGTPSRTGVAGRQPRPKPAAPGARLATAALAAAGALDDAVQRVEAAERAARAARGLAHAADVECEQAKDAVAAAERDLVAARDQVREVTARRTARRRAAVAADTAVGAARAAAQAAQRAADAAQHKLDEARRRN